ncbi:hypothetical protein BCR44DRAFT_34371 [Catenaria anguillulae PL171]|uniref:Pentacotripeptide-repeat region of PRORP domain-containing protein n=1 Tax=Catenaria anguillulae PL171 TaxID=765915 RepID=A0A1Y2HKU7_9FUNG|nr:hypothetical protein BCR44DRAFT_34371 [Catenaria anguillulae PL171]
MSFASRPQVAKLWHAVASATRSGGPPTTPAAIFSGVSHTSPATGSANGTGSGSSASGWARDGSAARSAAEHSALSLARFKAQFNAAAAAGKLGTTAAASSPTSAAHAWSPSPASSAAQPLLPSSPVWASSSQDLVVISQSSVAATIGKRGLDASSSAVSSATASTPGAGNIAVLRLLDRELSHLTIDDPVAAIVRRLRQVLVDDPSADRRTVILGVLQDATESLSEDPVAVAKLHLVAQRVLARLGDLEALREWKRWAALAPDSPNRLALMAPTPSTPMPHPSSGLDLGAAPEFMTSGQGYDVSPSPSPVPSSAGSSTGSVVDYQQQLPFGQQQPQQLSDHHRHHHHHHHHNASNPSRKPFLEQMSNELLNLSRGRHLTPAMQVFADLTSKSLTPLGDATHAYLELLATNSAPSPSPSSSSSTDLSAADSAFHTLRSIEAASASSAPKLARHEYFLYNSYLSACCTAGHSDRALQLYSEMKHQLGQLPDLRTLTRLFTLLAKRTTDPRALTAMVSMLTDLRTQGTAPYPLLFNLALGQAVAQHQIHVARALFDQMCAQQVVPTAVTFSTLIKGELAAGNPAMAMHRFHAMCAHPHAQPGAPRALRAQFANSVGPFNALIQHHVSVAGDATMAEHVFGVLERQFVPLVVPTGFTLHLLAAGCMLDLDSSRAVRTAVDRIRAVGGKYKIRANASHFLPVLEALAARGEWTLAREVVVESAMREMRVEPRGEAIEALVAQVYAKTGGRGGVSTRR